MAKDTGRRAKTPRNNSIENESDNENESRPNPKILQAVSFMESVEMFVQSEDFEISPVHEIKTQIELLNLGFNHLTNLDQGVKYTPLYVALKNALNRRLEEGTKQKPDYIAVETSIKLPTFNGVFADWEDFRDSFEIDVHKKTRLSDPEKLRKLISCLAGPPKDLINCFKLNDENAYQKAWAKLKGQYDNSYEAFKGHVSRIFKTETIEKGDTERATKCIATIQASVLVASKIVEERNPINCAAAVHLIQLMDVETREQWRLNYLNSNQIPSLEEVSEFLLEKVKTWEEKRNSSMIMHENNYSRESRKRYVGSDEVKRPTRRDDSNFRSNISCFKCKKNHYLNTCVEFRACSLKEKRRILEKLLLCVKCFKRQHAGNCGFYCNSCGSQEHNTILCPGK